MWKFYGFLLLSLVSAIIADEEPFRNFVADFNMGCHHPICNQTSPDTKGNSTANYQQLPNILYLHGRLTSPINGVNDTLHVVFSTYGGYPTILVVHCNGSSDPLAFDWKILLNDSAPKQNGIKAPVNCQNAYSFALVAVSAVDFNDTDDEADLRKAQPNGTAVIPLGRLAWTRMVNTSDPNVIKVSTAQKLNDAYIANNGTVSFRLAVGKVAGSRPPELPHLEFSGNSVQLDVAFENWRSQFINTRIALELMLVSQGEPSSANDAGWCGTKSIDDEYTPGTFNLNNWVTRRSLCDSQLQSASPSSLDVSNGYVQYKPIAYTKENEYTVQNTVTVTGNELIKGNSILNADRFRKALMRSITAAYFAPPSTSHGGLMESPTYNVSAVNITFGQVGDGFYRKTAWLKWTVQIGFGVPPRDSVSGLVIAIILVGLGLPIVLMIAGGVFYACRRWRANRAGYQRIN